MIPWHNTTFRQNVKTATDPWGQFMNTYLDTWAWCFLHIWYAPFKIPALHNDAEKFVSQFTLNGMKSNICKPN